jgi:exodeoxyribonuclease-5
VIQLSPQQSACKQSVVSWDRNPSKKQVFLLTGYAGSGKTTLIVDTTSELEGLTLYAAFTGKAALVMQSKGCVGASTIHKLIYIPSGSSAKSTVDGYKQDIEAIWREMLGECETETDAAPTREELEARHDVVILRKKISQLTSEASSPVFFLNPDSPILDAKRVVVDEVSMVDTALAKDLMSFGVPVLAQGDPGQLPPVAGEGFFMKGEPDFFLSEIHRQAAGSPILMLATRAREGRSLEAGTYGESQVIDRRNLTPSLALEADQILCGRNKTRHINNARMRELKGHAGPLPCAGEKLVCLRNNHEKGLLNGSLWTVIRASKFSRSKIALTVVPEEGGTEITVLVHEQYFTGYGATEGLQSAAEWEKWAENLVEAEKSIGFDIREAECFTFGYVLTVHKAMGSQWSNVLVIDESRSFGVHAKNHLYTAVTRAAQKVTVAL